MAVPTFDELIAPLTEDQVLAAELQTAALLQLPVTAWQPGGVVREVLEINATVLANQTQASQLAVRGGFLDYATRDWLTLNADQKFDVQRIEATFASGVLTLTNSGPTSYVLAPGDVRAIQAGLVTSFGPPVVRDPISGPGAGKTYTSISGGTLPAQSGGVPGTLGVQMVADEAGADSTAPAGYVSALATPLSGVTCANADTWAGTDEESDPSLIARCRASWARVTPNGPKDAYTFYALSASLPDGSSAGATRVLVLQQDGTIVVYCASPSGALPGAVGTPGTALWAVDQAIQANCVPTGLAAATLSAVDYTVPVSVTVYLRPGTTFSNDQVRAAVQSAMTAFFEVVPIGGYKVAELPIPGIFLGPSGPGGIYQNNLENVVFDALPGQVLQVKVTSPPGDQPLDFNQVAVLGALSITVQRETST